MDFNQKKLNFEAFLINYNDSTYQFPAGKLTFNGKNHVIIEGKYTHPFLMEDGATDQVISFPENFDSPIEKLDAISKALRFGATNKYVCHTLDHPMFNRFKVR